MSILLNGIDMPRKGEFSHVRIYDDGDITAECCGKEVVIATAVDASDDGDGERVACRCFYCGEELIWQNDYSFEDVGIDEDGLISCWVCAKCGAWYEIYKSFNDDTDADLLKPHGMNEKVGRWVKKHDDICWWSECSECGDRMPKNEWGYAWMSPYCPNCGAHMKGDCDVDN